MVIIQYDSYSRMNHPPSQQEIFLNSNFKNKGLIRIIRKSPSGSILCRIARLGNFEETSAAPV